MPNALSAVDVQDYQNGYTAGKTGGPPPAPVFYEAYRWFWREGYQEATNHQFSIPLGPGMTFVGPAWAPLNADDVKDYQQGLLQARTSPTFDPSPWPYWYREGFYDGLAGQDRRLGIGSLPTWGAPPPPPPGFPPGPMPPAGPLYLELVPKEFGRPVPYDLAVKIQTSTQGGLLAQVAQFGLSWDLLGTAPGDDRLGYRLSGPTGGIAKAVNWLISRGRISPDPSAYGLPAWVGTRTVGGRGSVGVIRLLSANELAQIGVLDQLQSLYETPFV